MRIRRHESVSREMLAYRGAAARAQTTAKAGGEIGDGIGVARKRAIADYAARTEVDIEHRSEAEVDAVRTQFPGNDLAQAPRLAGGARDIEVS